MSPVHPRGSVQPKPLRRWSPVPARKWQVQILKRIHELNWQKFTTGPSWLFWQWQVPIRNKLNKTDKSTNPWWWIPYCILTMFDPWTSIINRQPIKQVHKHELTWVAHTFIHLNPMSIQITIINATALLTITVKDNIEYNYFFRSGSDRPVCICPTGFRGDPLVSCNRGKPWLGVRITKPSMVFFRGHLWCSICWVVEWLVR